MVIQDSLHSLLGYECLLFWATDLVLIYESVISTSADSCLTLHNSTAQHWAVLQLTYGWLVLLCTAPYIGYR
jgi:hypothetical protein